MLIHDNTAALVGANVHPATGGVLYYRLPTPPGYWLPNANCVANREPCNSDEDCGKSPLKETCQLTSGTAPSWTPPDCKPPLVIQVCDWQTTACANKDASRCLLGQMVYLSLFAVDDTFPNPCAAGYVGSNESLQQMSSECAGKCPAGHYCPTAATLVPLPCHDGHYCDEGSTRPKPCPAGTRANASLAPMTGESQCAECSPGTWCSVGSLAETPCSPGTFNNQSKQARCVPCAGGTYQDEEGKTGCKEVGLVPHAEPPQPWFQPPG